MASDLRWCKIDQSGVLRFDGPDTQTFLQGQLTNNVNALTAALSHYTGYCSPKGRLLASPLLWRRDDAYHLLLPRALCEPLRKRLTMYILRSKVKAADISSAYSLFGVSGVDAAHRVATLTGTAPAATHAVAHAENADITVIRLPVQRYLIVAAAADAGRVEAVLAPAAAASPATLWDAWDIEAGIPSVVTATQEQFVPQTVNFDLIGAVSFDKGCYPGQEIVARTHYLGRVKQRMVRARIVASNAPAAGDKLYSATFGDQASGMIVAAAATDVAADTATDVDCNAVYDVLAVVQNNTAENAAMHWQSPTGPVLDIQPLPYAVK